MAPTACPEPVPSPKVWNPVSPVQNHWHKIEPWAKGYQSILSALGTIFAFGATIALIAEHKGQLPKWPFTAARWNPKPTVISKKPPEVSDEDILEDELAQVAAGGILKRSLGVVNSFNEGCYNEDAELSMRGMSIVSR